MRHAQQSFFSSSSRPSLPLLAQCGNYRKEPRRKEEGCVAETGAAGDYLLDCPFFVPANLENDVSGALLLLLLSLNAARKEGSFEDWIFYYRKKKKKMFLNVLRHYRRRPLFVSGGRGGGRQKKPQRNNFLVYLFKKPCIYSSPTIRGTALGTKTPKKGTSKTTFRGGAPLLFQFMAFHPLVINVKWHKSSIFCNSVRPVSIFYRKVFPPFYFRSIYWTRRSDGAIQIRIPERLPNFPQIGKISNPFPFPSLLRLSSGNR